MLALAKQNKLRILCQNF